MYRGRKVFVSGASGLIGSHLAQMLLQAGAEVQAVVHRRPLPSRLADVKAMQGDLTDPETCRRAVRGMDYVFHLAAYFGGLGMNALHPAGVYTPNILMNTNLLEAARLEGVDRYLFTSSACVYSNIDLFEESRGWEGHPEKANETYGWVKRMGELQARVYSEEYGMKIAVVRPTNAYGPGDNFDPQTSHAVAALIRKAVERQNPFVIWGDGQATRDFIFAGDAAEGMMLTLEKYPTADPVNLATGRSVKIIDLARMIFGISGHDGARIVFDDTRPRGQMARTISVEKAKENLGFRPRTSLEDGLRMTVDWYRENLHDRRVLQKNSVEASR